MNTGEVVTEVPVIKTCDVGKMPTNIFGPMPEITAVLSDGEEVSLGSYYPDEKSFRAEDFLGKTISEAKSIIRKRDVAYLQS